MPGLWLINQGLVGLEALQRELEVEMEPVVEGVEVVGEGGEEEKVGVVESTVVDMTDLFKS